METIYDFSFLTSPRDPRHDNWIGQSFALSYLNSEPGINYAFAYRPFSINPSRVNKESLYADRNIERMTQSGETILFDRDYIKDNTFVQPIDLFGLRRIYEAIIKHGFFGRLREAEAIVCLVADFADSIDRITRIYQEEKFADEIIMDQFINPIVTRFNFFFLQKELITDSVLQLYRQFDKIQSKYEEPFVTTVKLLDKTNISKETLALTGLILSKMKNSNEAVNPFMQLADRDYDGLAEVNYSLFIIDKLARESSAAGYETAVGFDIEAISLNDISLTERTENIASFITFEGAERIDEQHDATRLNHQLAYRQEMILDAIALSDIGAERNERHRSSLYEYTRITIKDVSFGMTYLNILSGTTNDKEAVMLESERLSDFSKSNEVITYDEYLFTPYTSKEVLITGAILGSESNNNPSIETKPILVDRYLSKEIVKTFSDLFDRAEEKEVLLTDYVFVERDESEAFDLGATIQFSENKSSSADISMSPIFIEISGYDAYQSGQQTQSDFYEKEAKSSFENMHAILMDRINAEGFADFTYKKATIEQEQELQGFILKDPVLASSIKRDSLLQELDVMMTDSMRADVYLLEDTIINPELFKKDAVVEGLQTIFVNSMEKSVIIQEIDVFLSKMPVDGINLNVFNQYVNRINQAAWIQEYFRSASKEQKLSMIEDYVLAETEQDIKIPFVMEPPKLGIIPKRDTKIEHAIAPFDLSLLDSEIYAPSLLTDKMNSNIGLVLDDHHLAFVYNKEAFVNDHPIFIDKYSNNQSNIYESHFVDLLDSKEGWITDSYIFVDFMPLDAYYETEIVEAERFVSKEVFTDSSYLFDRNIEDKEVTLVDFVYFERFGKDAFIPDIEIKKVSLVPEDALYQEILLAFNSTEDMALIEYDRSVYSEKFEEDSLANENYGLLFEKLSPDAWKAPDLQLIDEKRGRNSVVFEGYALVNRMEKESWLQEPDIGMVNDLPHNSMIMDSIVKLDAGPHFAAIDFLDNYADKGQDDARIEYNPIYAVWPYVPTDFSSRINWQTIFADLGEKEARMQEFLKSADDWEREAFVFDKEFLSTQNTQEAIQLETEIHQRIGTLSDKEAKSGRSVDNVELAKKEAGPAFVVEELMFDVLELASSMRVETVYSDNPSDIGIVLDHPKLGNEPINTGIIYNSANGHDRNEFTRDGYIPRPRYVLAGDESDWEDIWTRYSPGIDILDPPDSDYDYEQLANKVYNPETGVPYKPLSPTNVADVKVKTPLHHPLPQHADIGIDDSKELAVDNYTFIDVALAIESIKNRNKLRYAGMPGEKTVRELFSQLFTWINQAAPGNEEYYRMFRFARWYAESAVLSLSEHILHRVYNPWRSTFHTGNDLGLPYTQIGWKYYPTAYVVQTISTHAEYSFEAENYIDGEFIVRGYFDNPLSQGTMEIKVDGVTIDTLSVNGAFSRTYPVEQGNHTYEFVFDGESGRVSLSTIEISGSVFVSAHTTSDDSNTNGLKASTVLMEMLLAYFDTHHGSGKTKGTMQVKQRKLWNSQ